MSRQLLAASPGEDVGALLGHRDTGSTSILSAHSGPGLGGGAVLAAHTQDHPGLTEQWGQTKPLMFSTSPITRSPTFLQKVSSRLTSPTDTAWRPGKGQGQQIGEKGTAERLPQGEGACSGTVPEAW